MILIGWRDRQKLTETHLTEINVQSWSFKKQNQLPSYNFRNIWIDNETHGKRYCSKSEFEYYIGQLQFNDWMTDW